MAESRDLFKVRRFPAEEKRVETGPIMFGDDWPGTFIRGDDCHLYAAALREATMDLTLGLITRRVLMGLLSTLESSNTEANDAFPAWREEHGGGPEDAPKDGDG